MRTRSQSREPRPPPPEGPPVVIEPLRIEYPFQEDPTVEPMADTRTTRRKNKQFFGHDKEDPHAHIRYFNKITSTMRVPNVPIATIKLMLFPFSIEGAARIWLEKEPPRSIQTWDDLVSKFINQFFPPSKTTNLRNEITRFQQRFDESFYEAWDRFNDLLRACPHHGFSELHQLDTFYNALNINDQDSLNSAAGGNFLDKMPREFDLLPWSRAFGSTAQIPPPVIPKPIPEPEIPKTVPKANIPYPSRRDNQKNREKASYQKEKIFQMFQDLRFDISFADALFLMPRFAPTIRDLLMNKEKLLELVKIPLNENCSAMLLKKLPEKLGDPGKFLIPCEFPGMEICYALADLGASINLMPLSIWKKLSLPELSPTRMTLELADRSITYPKGLAEDVYVKVGKFHFPANFVVVDFEADPRVPLILGRSFLKTGRRYLLDDSQSTAPVQPPVGPEPITTPVLEPIVAPVVAPVPNTKPSVSLPYPSRRDNEKSRNQANEQIDKFYEIFKEMSFEISFTDALVLMPKFASTLRTLLGNKEKLTEVARTSNEPCLARTSMNEHCSAVILNKLPRKLGDPGKFLIPCEFPGMDECLALADLGASINLMPFSVWEKLSLPDLTPTCMTLELADRSISKPMGIAKDISVKVGVFHFPADFVVVDFDPDPRVPLILGRCFLKTSRALIDVHKGELTLRIGSEAITYNLDQTSRYSANYTHMTANKIDVIDMACEEYSQEVLGFTDIIASGNSTPYYDPIVATSSPTLTPFGDSDFLLLEEADSFLGLADDPDCPAYNPFYYDPEGDILILEAILNSEPPLPPPSQGTYLPEVRTELKVCETNTANSSVDEPTEVELKELPPHLEYAFLEGDNKLPVIIAKELDVEEKSALVKVLKSHKRALAWKLSDIQGINPEFCTHKILMEEDYAPAVQHQRRVNPKIHDVIKKEVEKLLEAGLIYPISDSPWVSPIHCVPKKGGMTVVVNEENELIPTRLVTGWRVCIDYRKLNEATRKDHFPLPFMDQMLERLAGNEYYCFLNGFLGYFQIPIDPHDQEKTTFTSPYGTFAYRRMPFGLCNAPGTFQRCMMSIFHDMIEKTMEVFMDDFSVFRNSFGNCLSRVNKMLQRIEVDKAKVDVIAKLPHPTTVKGVRSFLGHAGFYRRFIKDFSKIFRPMTHLLEKNTPFIFSDECIQAFETLKKKLTEAPILIAPDWDLPFELMCDASDFAIGLTYHETKAIEHTDPFPALKYLFAKKDAKARLLRWVLLLQEFDFKVIDTKGAENLAADHLSRLENPYENVNDPKEINESFPLETLKIWWRPFRETLEPRGYCRVAN
ncbi:reverse transcriptase domain-containing protein [Tanacetum coccineum]